MKIIKAIIRIVLIICVIVVSVLAIVQMPKRTCTAIQVIPHTQNESVVLSQQDVVQMLKDARYTVVGKKLKEVDQAKISKLLKANPYVQRVNFVHFAGTRLMIDYTLRNMVLHVFDADGGQYFVDAEGQLLPYTTKMVDNLIVANGNIHQNYVKDSVAKSHLHQILNLTNLINADAFCKAQFRQIYLNEHQQIELVSTIGKQIVLFGNDDNAAEKLFNLKQVYQNGLSHKGYDRYTQLDVRYKNRIIAQRKL